MQFNCLIWYSNLALPSEDNEFVANFLSQACKVIQKEIDEVAGNKYHLNLEFLHIEKGEELETTDFDFFLPIIADAEAGFGGPLNCFELMKSMIESGAAAVHFEDQLASEKKCGHLGGKVLVPTSTFERTLNSARLAADVMDVPTLIMARTDAIATRGLDDAIKRMQIFSELGVDILFIEAIKSKEDMKRVIKEVPGHHMINLIEDGDTPFIDMNELEDIGYKIAVMPLTLMSASVKTMQECLKNIKNKKYNTNVSKFSELREIVGFNEYYDIEDKYK